MMLLDPQPAKHKLFHRLARVLWLDIRVGRSFSQSLPEKFVRCRFPPNVKERKGSQLLIE